MQVPWVSPSYESATVSTGGPGGETVSVTVTLANATGLQMTTPFNVPQCARQVRACACATATLLEFRSEIDQLYIYFMGKVFMEKVKFDTYYSLMTDLIIQFD